LKNKSFVIIYLLEKKYLIKVEHLMEIKCVKKIIHSKFWEGFITEGRDK